MIVALPGLFSYLYFFTLNFVCCIGWAPASSVYQIKQYGISAIPKKKKKKKKYIRYISHTQKISADISIPQNIFSLLSFFSSPEHEVLMVSYCGQSMSVVHRGSCVVRRASSTIDLKAYSSYIPGPINSILGRKHRGDL